MRNAETVLSVIRDRGYRGLPLDDIYRQLFNPNLYLLAYSRIYKNDGAMTQGVTSETVDGMSIKKIEDLIEDIRYERFQWTPVRRINIPKKNGKTRPLGIPTWNDKLVQEVIRLILEAYYEPQFSNSSHGFRPKRGCHTALTIIDRTWQGTKWFIEGDIRGCFDNIDHKILMSILREKIQDNRFLRLIENLLKAGYCEQWKYFSTLSGTPQGSILSPILANIYLDKLDKFIEQILIPEYTRGKCRAENPEYSKLVKLAWYYRKNGQFEKARQLEIKYQHMPSKDVRDPEYRRLNYVRYADDFLLGFIGSFTEAEAIKEKVKIFLAEKLQLELSPEKTLITNARNEAAKFLGYEILVQYSDDKHTNGKRSINGIVALRIPAKVIEEKCTLYMRNGKPIHRPELINDDDFSIINIFQSEFRGYVQFYSLAQNIAWLRKLQWVMSTSLMKTLACKHKTSVNKICARYIKTVKLPQGLRKCVEITVPVEGKKPLVARFGGIQLKRNLKATIEDLSTQRKPAPRNELIKRLLADECEICGAKGNIEVHHIRALKDLKIKGRKDLPQWMQIMSARKRKTLMVCSQCHDAIHAGKPTGKRVP
ncbi:RNA-directed DNA polymerase (plasmid) [Calothrix sp. NIES-4071]|nr:RNA-directed DNA polymerase [Calothrix sp. NIES-4071]BAZ60311.1 RNA-directed DNA polymerase [Calothrix sp. NIES-4105]BAZ14576.1 RNA-directed DNA polymerase [Calothrix sp. NIES-4071]BAZ17290.1 RNA-directed DNA polymerase [Calothrix sp. NIES-4071]BAZ18978.1 RNA-directed DNA polymerase [Calothrix sp. NIES-4071]